MRAKVVKNKVAPPFRIAEFDMMHTDGISMEGDILDLAVDRKIVAKSGSWFKYGEIHVGQGKEKARAFLVENPDITEELRNKVFEADGLSAKPVPAVPEEEEAKPTEETTKAATPSSEKTPKSKAKKSTSK